MRYLLFIINHRLHDSNLVLFVPLCTTIFYSGFLTGCFESLLLSILIVSSKDIGLSKGLMMVGCDDTLDLFSFFFLGDGTGTILAISKGMNSSVDGISSKCFGINCGKASMLFAKLSDMLNASSSCSSGINDFLSLPNLKSGEKSSEKPGEYVKTGEELVENDSSKSRKLLNIKKMRFDE